MNDGVKILLERIKTNPEEFVIAEGIPAKWDNLIRAYEAVLDPEDIALFKQARNKLLQQQFTEEVMKELLDPKSEQLELELKRAPLQRMRMGGQIPVPSSVTPSLKQTIAKLEEIKKEYEPKKHKTIFGKLFNYS